MSDTTHSSSNTLRGLQEGLKEWVGLIAAVGFLIGFLVLNYLLFSQYLGLGTEAWNRAMVLYTSVEALALTAAGYLFGREVNRERATNAEQQAQKAQQQAVVAEKEAAREATKGRDLAVTIEQLLVRSMPKQPQPELEAATPVTTLDQIRQVVRSFYP